MIYKNRNFAWKQPTFHDGDVIEGGILCQLIPGTEICVGVKNLTFRNVNLVNCKLPDDATRISGNNCQMTLCSHERPDLVKRGLPECKLDCEHLVEKDEIEVAGHVVETVRTYEEKRIPRDKHV